MISLLVVAGISISANAVTWYNNRQLEKVNKEIQELQKKLNKVYEKDEEKREEITKDYLDQLLSFIKEEYNLRNELYLELQEVSENFREKQQLGRKESKTVIYLETELKKSLGLLEAEKKFLKSQFQELEKIINDGGGIAPNPEEVVMLPHNYPMKNHLINVDDSLPSSIHDYQLQYVDEYIEDYQGWAFVQDVDHQNYKARASFTSAVLYEARFEDEFSIEAMVKDYVDYGIILEYCDAQFFLHNSEYRSKKNLTPGATVEVYPKDWTIDDIRYRKNKKPLPVSLTPNVGRSKSRWTPIVLYLDKEQYPDLEKANEYLESEGFQSRPFKIHYNEEGDVVFTIKELSFVTSIDKDNRGFQLKDVAFKDVDPSIYIKMDVELQAVFNGKKDDEADCSNFDDFILALSKNLEEKRQFYFTRNNALSLRKFKTIYEDQIAYKNLNTECGFLPTSINVHNATIDGIITDSEIPNWLSDELEKEKSYKISTVGKEKVLHIRKGELLDEKLNLCRFHVEIPESVDNKILKDDSFNRIKLRYQGARLKVLSRALDKAASGKFVSPTVYDTLMQIDGNKTPNEIYGQDEVLESLQKDDKELVTVWGPPGTGKTTTIVNWLLDLFEPGNEENWPSVLIAGPTHVSVDNILERLLHENGALSEHAVRYCNENRIKDDLKPIWVEKLIDHLRNGNENLEGINSRWDTLLNTRSGKQAAIDWTISSKFIHAATCVGMAKREYNLTNREFDIVIIDEAGKAFPAELLLPASVGKKVVIVGDHKQLPPTVTEEDLNDEIGYRLSEDEVEDILKMNFFEKLYNQLPSENKGMLDLQYRMHKDIGDVISNLFYEGKVKSHRKNGSWKYTDDRLTFVDFTKVNDYKHNRSPVSKSLENTEERKALKKLLQELENNPPQDNKGNSSIMVVCPYKEQRKRVQHMLANLDLSLNIEATTVDSVQGGEATMVILLMTRNRGSVQFLLDRHRLNVALSRAEESVIIFGHRACLSKGKESPIRKLLNPEVHNGKLNLVKLRSVPSYRRMVERVID